VAGLGNDPVQVYRTLRDLHWEFLRLWTGFELSSSWANLPGYGPNLNRNILDFMHVFRIFGRPRRGAQPKAAGKAIKRALKGRGCRKHAWRQGQGWGLSFL
jgi:hypothetical protein